ncbi:uncharacterized protein PFLUO_LOCUS3766 [Penicillium psychrofluorescens]|uniref:uncharacterized protein n=1 Tax=Penicillium psychrofluorescens TaxID=3158075 RepID=UPI003CCD52DD
MLRLPSFDARLGIILNVLSFSILSIIAPAQATPLKNDEHFVGSFKETLARDGQGPYPYYRIVGLTSLGNGVLLAAFDGRPNGGDAPSPNSILQRRSTNGGKTWGNLTYIAKGQNGDNDTQQYGFSDPSYVFDHTSGTVFNFHVFSKNQGFAGSELGNNDTDLDVLSAEVSVSTDAGLSWSTDPTHQPNLPPIDSINPGAPPLITKIVKPLGKTVNGVANVGGVRGGFAASGEGIQLRYGSRAGRLIQQYVGRVIQSDGSTSMQAYSVYSDDSGKTWQMGQPVGSGMDENKVVELSNGDVMLNSRPSDNSGYRKVAISNDGGETYSTPKTDTQLPDPECNGAIARMYPDAAEGSTLAKILLFTNANNMHSRENGTIRYSCDDGATWSSGRVFQPNATGYSTVTALGNDKFGIFYEGPGNDLIFLEVNKTWIGVSC